MHITYFGILTTRKICIPVSAVFKVHILFEACRGLILKLTTRICSVMDAVIKSVSGHCNSRGGWSQKRKSQAKFKIQSVCKTCSNVKAKHAGIFADRRTRVACQYS